LHRARNGATRNGGAAPPEVTQQRWLEGVVVVRREDPGCCRDGTGKKKRNGVREFES